VKRWALAAQSSTAGNWVKCAKRRNEPDAWLEDDAEQLYVEVQGRGGEAWRRADKWRSQYRLQGRVAICADTLFLAECLAHEAQIAGVPVGYLTNLTDLADGIVKGLWTHRWRSQHSTLEVWR